MVLDEEVRCYLANEALDYRREEFADIVEMQAEWCGAASRIVQVAGRWRWESSRATDALAFAAESVVADGRLDVPRPTYSVS